MTGIAPSGGGGSYSDEQAQDAVGTAFTDSANIDFTYNDAGGTITAVIGLASQAQGDILYYNGTAWVRLAAGTLNASLTSGGAAANPSWQLSRGCLAYVGSDLTTQNLSTIVALPLNTESYDTNTIHDTVTNNTRLTVPSGITKVRLNGCLRFGAGTVTIGSDIGLFLYKNGAATAYPGMVSSHGYTSAVSNPGLTLTSPILTVTGGDYFELMGYCGDTSVTVKALETWCAMEIIE